MKEQFNEQMFNASMRISEEVRGAFLRRLMERIDKKGWEALPEAIDMVLDELNVGITYVDEGKEDFAGNRERLRTEPGIVIANHPGYFDMVALVKAAYRKDLKILAAGEAFGIGSTYFGSEHFLKATRDARANLAQLRAIKQHVETGGAFMFFPTAGADMIGREGEFEFRHGLAALCRKVLRPTDMVYSFYVEPEDIVDIMGEKLNRFLLARSGLGFYEILNLNRLKERKNVRVHERYTQAAEWQAALDEAPTDSRDDVLKRYFLRQFGLSAAK